MTPALIVLAGLPGTGKTTISRELARLSGAIHLRIDTIETAMRARGETFEGARGDIGYVVAYGLARDLLGAGHCVIVDAVHGWREAEALWTEALRGTHARLCRVQIVCSDPAVHRARVETRKSDIAALSLPTWSQVQGRDAIPFDDADLMLDTATLSAQAAAVKIVAELGP
ncbi:AAA family ATPase [Maritimibacter dapengensis]|uniref:AAA family ATPase n=1 Tax=Maritimibacter dapengensis TaxID=2836868 RepID=A0ABS6SYS2_9RHOB|nr:AAA family ATPase [Maritimibacter dapengensis]MBV7378102.1 AAA family ATPase [Maritimibacter dapengensis]